MCRDDRQGIVSAMRIPDRKIKCQFLDEPKQGAGLYSISLYQLTSEDNKSNYRPRALVAEEGYSMKRRINFPKYTLNVLPKG